MQRKNRGVHFITCLYWIIIVPSTCIAPSVIIYSLHIFGKYVGSTTICVVWIFMYVLSYIVRNYMTVFILKYRKTVLRKPCPSMSSFMKTNMYLNYDYVIISMNYIDKNRPLKDTCCIQLNDNILIFSKRPRRTLARTAVPVKHKWYTSHVYCPPWHTMQVPITYKQIV